MREILFRAKRLDNGEWIEGYYLKCPHQYSGFIKDHISVSKYDEEDESSIEHIYLIDPETVCQYTGQTDKNGTKIFEGDVVKVEGKPYEVKYMLGQFFVGINMPISYKRFDCEVIGNIFDNPELLKEGVE